MHVWDQLVGIEFVAVRDDARWSVGGSWSRKGGYVRVQARKEFGDRRAVKSAL